MEPPTDMSFRANAVSRGTFPSCRFYLVVVHYPTWWIPPLRLRCGRNDTIGGRFYGFAYSFQSVSRRPAALIRLALGRASFPPGTLLYRVFGWPVKRNQPSTLQNCQLSTVNCQLKKLPFREAFYGYSRFWGMVAASAMLMAWPPIRFRELRISPKRMPASTLHSPVRSRSMWFSWDWLVSLRIRR